MIINQKLIATIFLLPFLKVVAQENMKLPLETGIWKQENVYCKVENSVIEGEIIWQRNFYRYYSDVYTTVDTVIDDKSYLTVEDSEFGVMGIIRQDSNIVYYRPISKEGFAEEVVLYDFNIDDVFTINTV